MSTQQTHRHTQPWKGPSVSRYPTDVPKWRSLVSLFEKSSLCLLHLLVSFPRSRCYRGYYRRRGPPLHLSQAYPFPLPLLLLLPLYWWTSFWIIYRFKSFRFVSRSRFGRHRSPLWLASRFLLLLLLLQDRLQQAVRKVNYMRKHCAYYDAFASQTKPNTTTIIATSYNWHKMKLMQTR